MSIEYRSKIYAQIARAQKHKELARYYNINSLLGNDWAMFYFIIGGRKTGKSYTLSKYLTIRKKKLGEMCKNYWLRIKDTSVKALLANKATNLVDPDIQRDYDLEFTTKSGVVYNHGKEFMSVYALSTSGSNKGLALYDKDYQGEYNIVLDEFILDSKSERRTSFDILYNFVQMVETIARTTKTKIRVFFAANTCAEASGILASAFNFIPEKFGRFYLKNKRCVVDNLEPTEEYKKDRKGSIADILMGDDSNFTNELRRDISLIYKGRLIRPYGIIKFDKEESSWFTMWTCNDGKPVIKRYNHESLKKEQDFAMRPYLDTYFSTERKTNILDLYDSRALLFRDLTTQARFKEQMSYIRKT